MIANKPMEICPSLVIREMQTDSKMRYHYTYQNGLEGKLKIEKPTVHKDL